MEAAQFLLCLRHEPDPVLVRLWSFVFNVWNSGFLGPFLLSIVRFPLYT